LELDEITEVFAPVKQSLESGLDEKRELRDELNAKVRAYLDTRNEVNRQVKELISEVRSQKEIRDDANTKVKDLKLERAVKSEELKEIRTELRDILSRLEENGEKAKRNSGPSPAKIRAKMDALERKYERGGFTGASEKGFFREMKKLSQELKEAKESNKDGGRLSDLKSSVRSAERSQEEAHNRVEKAVLLAQEAHDLMVELSEEVDRLRDQANSAHSGLTKTKRDADSIHSLYIVSLRCIHSIQDLIKAFESRSAGGVTDEKTEVSDLMSKLMSGDTLSTEELMSLQRN
jgi:uncharacterized coiled-coil DUF342 family protein